MLNVELGKALMDPKEMGRKLSGNTQMELPLRLWIMNGAYLGGASEKLNP